MKSALSIATRLIAPACRLPAVRQGRQGRQEQAGFRVGVNLIFYRPTSKLTFETAPLKPKH